MPLLYPVPSAVRRRGVAIFEGVGQLYELNIILNVRSVLPSTEIRLVPDLVITYPSLEMSCGCLYVIIPGLLLLLGADGRDAHRAIIFLCRLAVKVVAVAEAEPGLNTYVEHIVHHLVKPSEIIDRLDSFGALPP